MTTDKLHQIMRFNIENPKDRHGITPEYEVMRI